MLSKNDKEQLRATIFTHLDGIATATTTFSLHKKGVLDFLLIQKKASLETLTHQFNANEGYLNVALRVLCAQGWLSQEIDNSKDTIHFEITDKSQEAFELAHLYEDAVKLLSYAVKFPEERIGPDAFSALEKNFKAYQAKYVNRQQKVD